MTLISSMPILGAARRASPSKSEGAKALLHALDVAIADALRHRAERQANHRMLRETRHALSGADDRTLRDMGLTRSEISSIASEATGDAEMTRQRIVRPHH